MIESFNSALREYAAEVRREYVVCGCWKPGYVMCSALILGGLLVGNETSGAILWGGGIAMLFLPFAFAFYEWRLQCARWNAARKQIEAENRAREAEARGRHANDLMTCPGPCSNPRGCFWGVCVIAASRRTRDYDAEHGIGGNA